MEMGEFGYSGTCKPEHNKAPPVADCREEVRTRIAQMTNFFMAVCTENLSSGVVVVKSAQSGACTDHTGSLNRARNRRILVQGSMRSDAIVQHDDGTPTGSRSTSFFIRGILGPDAWSIFIRLLRTLAERFSVAASLVEHPRACWRFP